MRHTYFSRLLAVVLVLGLAGAAHAQNGDENGAAKVTSVQEQRPSAVAFESSPTERRPPQAAPPDPSKDPTAPPSIRQVRRALGGFVGGMAGLAAGAIVCGMTQQGGAHVRNFAIAWPTAGVTIGIVLGTSLGGR